MRLCWRLSPQLGLVRRMKLTNICALYESPPATTNFKTGLVAMCESIFRAVLCDRRPSCPRSMTKSCAHAPSPPRVGNRFPSPFYIAGQAIQMPTIIELFCMPETSRIQSAAQHGKRFVIGFKLRILFGRHSAMTWGSKAACSQWNALLSTSKGRTGTNRSRARSLPSEC
jgi:hypothetical protein